MNQEYKSFLMALGALLATAVITMNLFSASLDTGLMSMSSNYLFSVGNGLLLINIVLIRIALKAEK
ncbi:MAG: hypothetical protein WCI77_05060 [Candidatus Omnitrophota bacterium]